MADLDLDVADPEEVADILREAAQSYGEAESELSSAWQDPSAGKVWIKIAKILEAAADKIDKII